MNDPKLKTCPKDICAKRGKVSRQLGTGAGIIFKGSGFYETDYRSESYKAGEKKAEEAGKKSSDKKDSSEKKPKKAAKKAKAASSPKPKKGK